MPEARILTGWRAACNISHGIVFFFTAPAPPEIYTLSLHDALPISFDKTCCGLIDAHKFAKDPIALDVLWRRDRKSTRLNSSHPSISYAVFCLKKKIDLHQEAEAEIGDCPVYDVPHTSVLADEDSHV